MEPVRFLAKIKIAENLFSCQVVKHYTKILKKASLETTSFLIDRLQTKDFFWDIFEVDMSQFLIGRLPTKLKQFQ
jgi:hypothetical protein